MPLCDSSDTCTRAVWPEPSPAVLRLTCTAGISEVPRFSCMKFLGVSGVFHYAGPSRNSRLSPLFMLPSAHYKDVGVRIASFRSSIAHPTYSPVYASLCTSRYPTQNSGPSGSLLLTRENFAFSASCRFIPAHCNRLVTTTITAAGQQQYNSSE
jgi:hypothetical protein